jgi:hypothetical protein
MKHWSKVDWICFTLLTLCVMAILTLCGCSSTKNVTKENRDSSVIKEYQDSLRVLSIENEKLLNENLQLQYLGISFDTVFLPGDTIRNTITVREGSIIASGRIKNAKVGTSNYEKILSEKDRLIDSLKTVKSKETVRVVTEYKDKVVKRTVFPWWFLLIAGAVFIIIRKFKL